MAARSFTTSHSNCITPTGPSDWPGNPHRDARPTCSCCFEQFSRRTSEVATTRATRRLTQAGVLASGTIYPSSPSFSLTTRAFSSCPGSLFNHQPLPPQSRTRRQHTTIQIQPSLCSGHPHIISSALRQFEHCQRLFGHGNLPHAKHQSSEAKHTEFVCIATRSVFCTSASHQPERPSPSRPSPRSRITR